ncbi:GNAT family N-acetyltransferase [soil metagenome]
MAVTEYRIGPVAPADTYPLRQRVLRPRLAVADVAFPDDEHADTAHLAARDQDGTVVGIARVSPEPCPWASGRTDGWQLRSMATAPERRGQGIGALLLERAVRHVADSGGGLMWCNARSGARSLYERAGFVPVGAFWDDPELGPHLGMTREVPA